jgi:hypothetical protein
MKKLLIFALMIGTVAVFVPSSAQARSTAPAVTEAEQLWSGQQPRGRYNNRRPRTYTTTRIVRTGRATYRETIRVTRYANGRTRSQVIRRVRIR